VAGGIWYAMSGSGGGSGGRKKNNKAKSKASKKVSAIPSPFNFVPRQS
jgi:hypothetical protein